MLKKKNENVSFVVVSWVETRCCHVGPRITTHTQFSSIKSTSLHLTREDLYLFIVFSCFFLVSVKSIKKKKVKGAKVKMFFSALATQVMFCHFYTIRRRMCFVFTSSYEKSPHTSHNLWHTIFRNNVLLHYSLKAQIYSMNVPIYFSVWNVFSCNFRAGMSPHM